ncbi:MAG TPA: dTDP-4-dehydrorhamnose 3,5-epimerase [Dongiaceae bacterium]|nr:dTDP-4-dehydrorhamnose 3,5-epimerase [Dongiaceae bacterium]
MMFIPTQLSGVTVIDVEPIADDRGHFARWYCEEEFARHGLKPLAAQGAISRNLKRGTLRGLHFIEAYQGEEKLVRCVAGAVFDVAVDLRPYSPSFKGWTAIELTAKNHRALYLPRGCAHGFLTLTDHADVAYQFSEAHRPGIEIGVRWDDPEIGVVWPFAPETISERDRTLPFLKTIWLQSDTMTMEQQ